MLSICLSVILKLHLKSKLLKIMFKKLNINNIVLVHAKGAENIANLLVKNNIPVIC